MPNAGYPVLIPDTTAYSYIGILLPRKPNTASIRIEHTALMHWESDQTVVKGLYLQARLKYVSTDDASAQRAAPSSLLAGGLVQLTASVTLDNAQPYDITLEVLIYP